MKHSRKSSRASGHGSHRQRLPYPYTAANGEQVYRVKKRRHRHRGRKIVLAVLGVLVLIALAVSAAAMSYMNSLGDKISLGAESEGLQEVLSDVQADEPFYVLVLGSDTRGESNVVEASSMVGRSDVMMLVRVDTVGNKVSIVSIPRDTPYTEADGSIVKINQEYVHGAAASVTAVEEITGVEISHYVNVSFAEFENVIDYLGGVEVDVPIEITNSDVLEGGTVTLEPGRQTLDGRQALVFARSRFDYAEMGDVHRQSAVRQIVTSVLQKVRAKPASELPATVQMMASCVNTDMDLSELVRLAMAMRDGDVAVYNASGPYAGGVMAHLEGEPWMCYEDPEGWAKLIAMVDAGDDPSSVTYVGDTVKLPGLDETFVLDETEEVPTGGSGDGGGDGDAEAEANPEAEAAE